MFLRAQHETLSLDLRTSKSFFFFFFLKCVKILIYPSANTKRARRIEISLGYHDCSIDCL